MDQSAPPLSDADEIGLADEPPAEPMPDPAPPASPEATVSPKPAPPKVNLRGRRPKGRRWWQDAPAWATSAVVHTLILGTLAFATLKAESRKDEVRIDTAMIDTKAAAQQAEELVHILADPAEGPRGMATDSPLSIVPGVGVGTGAPGAGAGIGVATVVSERSSLPGVKVAAPLGGPSQVPTRSTMELGSGGRIKGDVTRPIEGIGEALDQLAAEILRQVGGHRLTVVWLFDESGSMKDDQRAVKEKFDRVVAELKQTESLSHAIVGFGQDIHFELEKPTSDIAAIGRAIDRLRVDESGVENTLEAIQAVIARYNRLITKDRKLLIVLITDESGDDGSSIEEARQLAVRRNVPIYVMGRQALFGYDQLHLTYIDPVTKDVYWPTIRRGPEAADFETLQADGIRERRDEQPSGFAPYELARMAKDTGGIYFLLPTEESMRTVRDRERAYSILTLKEYVPNYESRMAYVARREKSDLRRTLHEIILRTRDGENNKFSFRYLFPILPAELVPAATEAGEEASARLVELDAIEKRLRQLQPLRDRETEKRWQAHYDLMLAQIVTFQIKAYEYRACLAELIQKRPRPSKLPEGDLHVEWLLDHSPEHKAPAQQTEKKYAEAERLLKLVIERHPKTPWADLAQDTLNRGLGVQWREHQWMQTPQYHERAQLVPKY